MYVTLSEKCLAHGTLPQTDTTRTHSSVFVLYMVRGARKHAYTAHLKVLPDICTQH